MPIGDDGDRDLGAGFLDADAHAFHGALDRIGSSTGLARRAHPGHGLGELIGAGVPARSLALPLRRERLRVRAAAGGDRRGGKRGMNHRRFSEGSLE